MEDGGPLAYPRQVKPGWTAHVNRDGRLYYCNQLTKTASWLPPADTYDVTSVLPFGWEEAVDSNGISYFINHVNQTTTKDPPPKDWAPEEAPPKPRVVTLNRDAKQGFGFVAGSEKPVIVRFVTDCGPSDGKLLPGDQILEINGEDVRKAAREHAIQLIRSCPDKVDLLVCQPPLDNSARKSALLSVAKKAKLRSHPSRVRFAEGVVVNGSNDAAEKGLALMPNVLKVFLENGQTKSFKYDGNTTVQDVTESLLQKLGIVAGEHFCLVLEHVTGRRNKLTLLQPHQQLAKIASRPGSHNLRCLFRVVFVPVEPESLMLKDPIALEYLYLQCCNDVVQERFAPELKYEAALKLAALHIQQHAMANNLQGKLGAKNVEKEFGLEKFVPISLMETMKRKELRKLIGHFLKLCATQTMSDLQAKLYYLHIISGLPSYGAKCFATNIKETNMETVVLISPKFGVSQIAGMRSNTPMPLADIQSVRHVTVSRQDELSTQVTLHLLGTDQICLSMEDKDAEEMVLVLRGYYHLLTGVHLSVDCPPEDPTPVYDSVPPYQGFHLVVPDWWSYIAANTKCQLVNLSVSPPYHAADGKTVDSNMNSMLRNANKESRHSGDSFEISSDASEEVRHRLSEMHRLVLASEQYLTDHADEKESDSEGSSQMSSLLETEQTELRHSDSLLLLTQGSKAQFEEEIGAVVRSLEISAGETESSDTDSLSTPASSPSHEKRPNSLLKPSDSSFGLHSPDNVLPAGCRANNSTDMKDFLLRMQQDTDLPYQFSEGSLYLDPDIIDLTMIPPPITPDNVALSFLDSPSSPPILFADHLPPPDRHMMGNMNTEWDQDMLDELLDSNLDLDEFLATVVVPAPLQSGICELTPEEVSAFIIPPPPPPSATNVLASLNFFGARNHNLMIHSARSSFSYRKRHNMVKHEKVSLPQAKEKINQISEQLLNLAEQCRGYIAAGGGENQDVNLYKATQTKLCNEVRVLVASSKLLVQAAAEGLKDNLEGTLANCLNSLNNMFCLSEELCLNTDAPTHTMSLILRSREVSECLINTIHSIDNPKSTSNVQKCAEDLVNALTSLLKGLKALSS